MKTQIQKDKDHSPSRVTTGNIFEDLGFNKAESAALRIKADLLISIQKIVKRRGYKQRDLEKLLDQPQPRISELLRGRISRMSIDKLVDYLHRLGAETKVNVSVKKQKPKKKVA